MTDAVKRCLVWIFSLSPFIFSVLCKHVNMCVSRAASRSSVFIIWTQCGILIVHQASQFILTSAQIRVCVAVQQQPQASAECCLCKSKVILTYETHPGQTEKVELRLYFSISLPLNRQLCLLKGNISQTTLTAAETQHDTKCIFLLELLHRKSFFNPLIYDWST